MLLAGRIENFKEYSKFKNLKDFNNNIEMFLAEHKEDFTKSELVAFKRLVRFSAKFVGVANAKIGTLLKAINEKANGFGVSRSTFERMLRKAKSLGILTVENTRKIKGGKGHNVYVFNTIEVLKREKLTYRENSETSRESKKEQDKIKLETSIHFESSLNNNIKKRIEPSLNYTYVADYVPKEFTNLVKCFFDDAKTIEEYWRMVKIDTYHIKSAFNLEDQDILHTAIHSFKQMIQKLKKGKIKKSPVAYFKGIFSKKIDEVYLSTLAEMDE
jgi:hypothetical protein